jgi:hypothetical protein
MISHELELWVESSSLLGIAAQDNISWLELL